MKKFFDGPLVRAWGLEPQRITAREPKGNVTLVIDFFPSNHDVVRIDLAGIATFEKFLSKENNFI